MTNLLLIDCHDLGRHLGCYGRRTVDSPNLDFLAQQGIRFASSFCAAPQCSPSRATLYTGRYPHANGMFGLAHDPFSWRLHADERYLASHLQEAGYETALIGGQHVTRADEESIRQLGFDRVHTTSDAAQIVADTAQFLSEPHEKPFFLNIGFFETHRDEIGRFRNHPPDRVKGVEVPPYLPDTPESRQEAAELQGSVKHLDAAVGAILDVVRQQGLLHDTWVIFTTDHGIAMPRAKCTLYDPGIETALIMLAEPFGLVGGRVVRDLISHVDLTPTILDALGVPIPDRLQGRSYWPLLQGEAYTPRQHIFAEKTYHTAYEPQRAIRTEHYKLIANLEVDIINVPADIQHSPIYPQMIDELTYERPPLELYDLMEDPLERHNLTGDPAHAEIQRALTQTLLAWMKETNDPILRGPIPSPYYHRAMRLLGGDS